MSLAILDFWRLGELHDLLQLESHRIVHDAIAEVNILGVTPVHGGERVVAVEEHNNHAGPKKRFIFPANVAEVDLKRHCL